ncbi:MAG: FAD-dependent oxidoreductase [Flavobacteriales bacterium]
MMDLASGLPYHLILNGLPYRYPALQRDMRCDVVIVGAGITGALCAHACMKAGIQAVVLDVRSIGIGSTAASTALLQYELDTPLHALAGRIGERDAVRTYVLSLEAVGDILALAQALGEESASPRQSFQYASRRAHSAGLRKEHALRRANGLPVEFLERPDVHRLFPSLRTVGLLSGGAAQVDPYAFTHRLLQDVLRMGGSVFERTEVTHWEQGATGAFDLRTRAGHRIHAEHLVLATGYESQHYLPEPLLTLHSTYAVASERIERTSLWYQDCLIWETAQPYLYMRTTPDRRVLLGGLDEPFRDPKRRDRLLERKIRHLTRSFQRLMPDVPFTPEFSWCGTFGSTPDGLPYIDRDPRTGAWFVLGMGGNGITFSHTGAMIVRNAILGKPDADARLFRFDR